MFHGASPDEAVSARGPIAPKYLFYFFRHPAFCIGERWLNFGDFLPERNRNKGGYYTDKTPS